MTRRKEDIINICIDCGIQVPMRNKCEVARCSDCYNIYQTTWRREKKILLSSPEYAKVSAYYNNKRTGRGGGIR